MANPFSFTNSVTEPRRLGVFSVGIACLLLFQTHSAAAESPTTVCRESGSPLHLHVTGNFRDYPASSVAEAVQNSFPCPNEEALKSTCFSRGPLHLKASVVQPRGQGQANGHISVTLFWENEAIRSSRVSLSPFSNSQPPSVIKGDLARAIKLLWSACTTETTDQ